VYDFCTVARSIRRNVPYVGRIPGARQRPGGEAQRPFDVAMAQLSAVAASADDAIITKDLDGIITSWNPGAERMFGHRAAEAIGRPITIIIPPERFHEEAEILARLRRGEAISHFETERIRGDGSRVPISLAVSPMRDADGRIIGVSKIARDITDRRRGEQTMRETVQRLEILYRLVDTVGRARDVAAVCEAAVEAIVAAGADRASVLLFDGEDVMRFRAWRNLSASYRVAVDGHSPWSRETKAPEPVVIEDVQADPTIAPLRDVISAEGIRSLAFLPLTNDGRLLGKFMVYYDSVHRFSEAELRLAAGIGHHVAFGLARVSAEASAAALLAAAEAARRREEAARIDADARRRVAEELARLAHVMIETLDVDVVAQRIVDAALDLFQARGAALRVARPDGSLVSLAFGGALVQLFSPGHVVPAGRASASGLAILHGEAVRSDDTFSDSRFEIPADLRQGMLVAGHGAVMAAPLRNGQRVFGALAVTDRTGRGFTPSEVEILAAFADQAALALDNARLYAEARRRQREAEIVAEVTQRINAPLDVDTIFRRLVEGARELCEGDIARIVVREPTTGRMTLRHQIGTRWTGYRGDLTVEVGHGSGGIVLLTGRAFRTDDYAHDPRISAHYRQACEADGTVAQIVVPIPGEAGIAGLLYVDRRERLPFTDSDEAVLLRLAAHAATAILNSQLFAAERAARAEADAANRAKDQFLAVLSHELRTPLNAILGWSRLLRRGHLDDAERAGACAVIERNALLQAQLVADLLDVSRIAAGKMEIDRIPVDLVLVVREALEAVASEVEAKKLLLSTALDDAAGEVLGEARRLQQIVSNLLLNAIKFTPNGGRVELRLERHETSARLTVRDTGIGIEPALLARIFDPFEQGDTTTTRRHQGLGLGLAIVRQLVALHGGTIRADSGGAGQGATFTVDLPVLAVRVGTARLAPDAGSKPLPRTGGRLSGLRVLVVDDQADARDLLALVLTEEGGVVHVAGSASEALDRLATHDIDVLISDISMPEMDGYELIRIIRGDATRMSRLRAIAVTAYTGQEPRDRAVAAGFDAHATKPVDAANLVRLLETFAHGEA
jgi:PAS domain S-box-containing protein